MTVQHGDYALRSVAVAAAIARAPRKPWGASGWEFLVQRRRDNGRWEPPAGVIDDGEGPFEACAREALEETGVTVIVRRLSVVTFNLNHPLSPVTLTFWCSATGGTPQPTAEASEVRWMTGAEVAEVMVPAQAVRLLDAVKDGVAVYTHDGTHLLTRDGVSLRFDVPASVS